VSAALRPALAREIRGFRGRKSDHESALKFRGVFMLCRHGYWLARPRDLPGRPGEFVVCRTCVI